jgi:hypothetical protein
MQATEGVQVATDLDSPGLLDMRITHRGQGCT